MLQDPKSQSLVANFGRQWLNLRNLDDIQPDRERFPTFSEELRDDMLGETDRFFTELIREDRSLLDFLEGEVTPTSTSGWPHITASRASRVKSFAAFR